MGTNNLTKAVYQFLTLPIILLGRIFIALNILNTKTHYSQICQSVISTSSIYPPQIITRALVTAEDRRFWKHKGVDFYAILRAVYRWFSLKKIEGASTIEQQLVRVLIGDYRLCLTRKFIEVILAVAIGHKFSKQHLVSAYLNFAYCGPGLKGYLSVCSRFHISPNNMDAHVASFVVATIRRPIPRNCTPQWSRLHSARCNWIYSNLIDSDEPPNPPLNSDPSCIAIRSLSASRFPGSAHRLGAGGAG